MMNVLKQFECKDVRAGEILFNTTFPGNVLLFVATGTLMLLNKKRAAITEVNEGHFILLPAEMHHIATAITSAHTIFIYAGPLSDMITNDPKWDPEHPIVLPIHPTLAHTLYQIEYFNQENRYKLN